MDINKELEKANKELAGAKEEYQATTEKAQKLVKQANRAVDKARESILAKQSVVNYLEGLASDGDDKEESKEGITEDKQ